MNLDELNNIIGQAKRTIDQGNEVKRQLAGLLRNSLRSSNMSNYVLEDLKRELRDYNIHTGCWKDGK